VRYNKSSDISQHFSNNRLSENHFCLFRNEARGSDCRLGELNLIAPPLGSLHFSADRDRRENQASQGLAMPEQRTSAHAGLALRDLPSSESEGATAMSVSSLTSPEGHLGWVTLVTVNSFATSRPPIFMENLSSLTSLTSLTNRASSLSHSSDHQVTLVTLPSGVHTNEHR
jgi:hypothetical protein